jgi:hypothetical protein
MSFFWFGDSWVTGDELQNEVSVSDINKHTYAYLTSKFFNTKCYNYATNASSIPHLLMQLTEARPKIRKGDTLFFCLTFPDRNFILGEDNKASHLYLGSNAHNDERIDKTLNKIWYKYIDSDAYREMAICNAIDLIKAYCNEMSVKCYFYNGFSNYNYRNLQLLTDDDWLIPSSDCLGSEILHIIDNEYFTIISCDLPYLTNDDWNKHNVLLEKYFRPNHVHPNVLGHQTISKRIIKILNEITT